ncbi:MAG: peptidase S58 family protein, partial [Candidatus Schekmanbacteria bacterium]
MRSSNLRGVRIGHYTDLKGVTGCTVFLFDDKAVCSYSLLGNAAGTKELTPLEENHIVEKIDGICISGGSAFGLDASSGVMRYLEERGKGFDAGIVKVPIVPSAIIFDLAIGDFKARPNERDGYTACENAKEEIPERGSVGAGTGATVG